MRQNQARVGTIILAAGSASRMGQTKQILPFEGRSLLRRAAEAALGSKSQTVVVVLGANALRVAEEVEDVPVLVALNPNWSEGMSTSVRAGLEALERIQAEPQIDAAVIAPCDQPHLSSDVLNRLIEAHSASGKPIVVSVYNEIWGAPMLFARALWPELHALSGSRGAQSVALRHGRDVECVPFDLGALDIDTRGDYEQLLATPRRDCPP